MCALKIIIWLYVSCYKVELLIVCGVYRLSRNKHEHKRLAIKATLSAEFILLVLCDIGEITNEQ